jgi:glyoxylase-like metal-dependent hydrolase (beta-lactamase superfamily II)
MVLWIERSRAVISGDTLVDFGRGLEINGWLRGGVTREQVVEGLRPLLDLPVDVVLATHGGPTDRTALERALLTDDPEEVWRPQSLDDLVAASDAIS